MKFNDKKAFNRGECKLPYSWANLKEKIINFKIEQNEKDTVYRKSNYCYVETT